MKNSIKLSKTCMAFTVQQVVLYIMLMISHYFKCLWVRKVKHGVWVCVNAHALCGVQAGEPRFRPIQLASKSQLTTINVHGRALAAHFRLDRSFFLTGPAWSSLYPGLPEDNMSSKTHRTMLRKPSCECQQISFLLIIMDVPQMGLRISTLAVSVAVLSVSSCMSSQGRLTKNAASFLACMWSLS